MHTVLWKRLDREGRDACRFLQVRGMWVIEGNAVFDHGTDLASISYHLVCDSRWESIEASVKGWVGSLDLDIFMQRTKGGNWCVNGNILEDMAGLKDVDLGFTPATNTNPIRRLCLRQGEEIEITAVWLDTDDWTVKRLPQRYRRTCETAYDYSSPLHDFRATLRVNSFGVVTEYPDLWLAPVTAVMSKSN